MEKYIEVLTRILELSDTLQEGIEHIQLKLAEEKIEDAKILLHDVAEALEAIDQSLSPIEEELPDNSINYLNYNLLKEIKKIILSLLEYNEMELIVNSSKKLLPAYRMWKQEMQRVIGPLILH